MKDEKEKELLSKAVDEFAQAMKDKLFAKIAWRGWRQKRYYKQFQSDMNKHVIRQFSVGNQEVDIANYAMFIWHLNRTK